VDQLRTARHDRGGNPQTLGSIIAYLRRYPLQAACGIAPEDDDGNAATGREQDQGQRSNGYQNRPYQRQAPQPAPHQVPTAQLVQRATRPVVKGWATPPWEPSGGG
jgi:hypothetical protein